MSFEKKLSRLEEIVQKMETGEITLDESLNFLKRELSFPRECFNEISTAEQKSKS